MSDIAITVENLSKHYRLGEIGATSLRESAERWLHRIRGRNPEAEMGVVGAGGSRLSVTGQPTNQQPITNNPSPNPQSKIDPPNTDLWALRDVSFEVKRGEVLGLIGRNGAGKSTLLKILTRITEPTSGRAIMRGRVASLLEVGTGFHPELSGRENVYLSGAILGMKKREIAAKFDEIVAFAEVERFIDTPVKRYSSGMYVRLAFAVAAHLEPEILLVDEVLAVGDAAFQQKCLGKMGDVANQGRTIIFVSHNMGAVNGLCTSAILLERGQLRGAGTADKVVSMYMMNDTAERISERKWDIKSAPGDETARLMSVRVCQSDGVATSVIDIEKPMSIECEILLNKRVVDMTCSVVIQKVNGVTAVHTAHDGISSYTSDEVTTVKTICGLPAHCLGIGQYRVSISLDIPNVRVIAFEENILTLTVEATSAFMGKFVSSAWRGVTGPGIAMWTYSSR